MTPRISTVRNEKGVALPLALFALVMLSGLLLTLLSMAGMEPQIAQNHLSSTRALYMADAGIEHAWAVLPSANIPAPFPAAGWKPFNDQPFGGGTYSVTVSQNPDGTYLLTSTGASTNASRIIRAIVSLGPSLPSPRGAAETLVDPKIPKPNSQKSKTEFDADPYGSFDGRDWIAPANISACTDIAGCGTLLTDPKTSPPTYGAFTNMDPKSMDHITQVSSGGNIVGTGCLPPACSGTSTASVSTQGETVLKDQLTQFTRWDSFIDAAKPLATQTLTDQDLTGTYTFGTAAAPQITVINWNKAGTGGWDAEVSGAGVLIIEVQPTGNVTLRGKGGLNWQGLIIVRGVEVEFEIGCDGCKGPDQGVNRIFGQVVNRSSAYAEIEFENKWSFVKYSSAAMNMVRQQFQSAASFKSWQDVVQ